MRPAGRFEEFLAQITAVNNSGREGLPYVLTVARVLNRFPDVEHPNAVTALAGASAVRDPGCRRKLLGLGIPPSTAPSA